MNGCFRVLLLLRSALLGVDISSLCGHSFALFMWVEKVSNDFGLHDNFYIHEIKLILDYACSVVEVAYAKFQSVNKFKIHGIFLRV
jgi:hypothetical protein